MLALPRPLFVEHRLRRAIRTALCAGLLIPALSTHAEQNATGDSARAASSEEEQGARTMRTIRVEDESVEDAPYAVKRSRSATKTDTPLLETPQSVTVISAAQVRDQASPNLQEVLRYAAGVRNELYGIDNRGDWFALRGSEESTILLDGMRLPLTGWYGVVRVEPYAYERIEVLRGPSSIIAGQNDPGGVVNLVSKRPLPDAARELSLVVGNYDHRELRSDITGPLDDDGKLLYRLVTLGKQSGTQIEHADEERALFAPSLTWRPSDRASLTVYGEYQYDDSENTNAFLGLDGTLRPAPNGRISRDLFIGEPSWDTYGGTRYRLGYAGELQVSDHWQLRHSLRHDDVEGLMESMYAAWWDGFVDASGTPTADGEYLNRLWYIYDDSARVTASEVLAEGKLQTGGIEHTLLFGVDGMLHDSKQLSAEGAGTPLHAYHPVYGTFTRPTLAGATPVRNEITRFGALVQDQMKLFDSLSLRLGLRRDKVRNVVVGSERNDDTQTSVNAGAVYEVLPGLAPYVSYSESFTPVSGTDARGRSFKPKRGEQIEAGLKWEAQSIPLQASAAFYRIEEKNRLANDPVNVGSSVQLGKSKVRGVELDAQGTAGSWSLLANYSYSRVRASAAAFGGDLNPDEQIEGIPEHTASLWLVHDFESLGLPGLRLGGGARYVDRIGDGTGSVFVPSVTLLDAMASYDVGPWRLSLNANNLTDKSYIATCLGRGDCWFGQQRRVFAGVTYLW